MCNVCKVYAYGNTWKLPSATLNSSFTLQVDRLEATLTIALRYVKQKASNIFSRDTAWETIRPMQMSASIVRKEARLCGSQRLAAMVAMRHAWQRGGVKLHQRS